jgi:hypothetical protein
MAYGIENGMPTVHRHEGCGIEYLLGTKQVLFETGAVMDRLEFDKIKGNPDFIGVVSGITDKARTGFDWKHACATGKLRRKKEKAVKAADKAAETKTGRRRFSRVKEAETVKAGGQKEAARKGYVFSSVFLVMAVMTIVGAGSAVMSAYHTSAFLVYGGKPAWTSVMTGIMLILFSGTAFTAARYFFNERGAVRLFGALFVAAGLAVIAYSMFSTLTVNFNQFKWRDDEQASTAAEESEALAAYRERIRLIEEEISEVTREIAVLREDADYWRSRSWGRYDSIQERITGRSEYLNSLRERYGSFVDDTPRLVEGEAVSQETIYTFLGRLFKVGEDAMRFFVYVVPACLYDILAPFSLSVVLLLIDKRKKGEDTAAHEAGSGTT